MTQTIFASYDHMALLADYHAPEMHAHLCAHLALASEGTLTYTTDAGSAVSEGVFIDSDVSHTIQSDSPLLLFFFDETSALRVRIKERYFPENPVAECPNDVVDRMRRCLTDFYANTDSQAFDLQAKEILLGAEHASMSQPATAATTDERIADALSFLHAQQTIGSDIVDKLAQREYLSKSRLSHLFTQEMGISLHRYLAFVKMKKAAEYIATGASLTDAALRAGFNSSSHLSSTVKRMFGISMTDVMHSMQQPRHTQ